MDSVLQPEPAGGGLEIRQDARVGGPFAGVIGGVWRDWGNDPWPGMVLELHGQYGEVVGQSVVARAGSSASPRETTTPDPESLVGS